MASLRFSGLGPFAAKSRSREPLPESSFAPDPLSLVGRVESTPAPPRCPLKIIPLSQPSLRVHQEEVALLAGIAEGDSSAFGKLYDRLAATMFSLVRRILRSHADAEDVLQFGFQQIWERAAEYDADRGSPLAWIATIMRHKAIDVLRSRYGQLERITRAFQQHNVEFAIDVGCDHLVRSEQHYAVRDALSRLSPDERKAIELAFFDGLTHLEIARLSGDPVGTIKARIRRGLLKLRPALAGFADFPIAA